VREALAKGMTLRQLVLQKGRMDEADFDRVVSGATGPNAVDERILKKIKRA